MISEVINYICLAISHRSIFKSPVTHGYEDHEDDFNLGEMLNELASLEQNTPQESMSDDFDLGELLASLA